MRKHPHPSIARREPLPSKPKKIKEYKPPPPEIEEAIVPVMAELPVTVICTNYRTPKLVVKAVNTFRACYPMVKMIIVDNGNCRESKKAIRGLAENGDVLAVLMKKNVGHGPAMNLAIREHVNTFYTFLLDSDTETLKSGFLERMIDRLGTGYAIGWMRYVDKHTGVPAGGPGPNNVQYIHPHAALIRTDMYKSLPAFQYHGAPCLDNMRAAVKLGYKLIPFNIQQYIKHMVAGTRRLYGGAWDVKQKPPTSEWKSGGNYPI